MDDERITLRMGTNDVQSMDNYLEEHPELGTRSQFIRTALREYMKRDAHDTPSDKKTDKGDGIFVRFSRTELDAMRNIVGEGYFITEEEFIRDCVRKNYSPIEKGPYAESFATAQMQQNVPL